MAAHYALNVAVEIRVLRGQLCRIGQTDKAPGYELGDWAFESLMRHGGFGRVPRTKALPLIST